MQRIDFSCTFISTGTYRFILDWMSGAPNENFYTEYLKTRIRLFPFSQTVSRGPFLESPDNFSGPESYFMSLKFTLKIQILLVFSQE